MGAIKVEGVAELQAFLGDQAKLSAVRKAVMKNGARLQSRAMHNAPVKTGFLRRSIGLEIADNGLTAIVEPTASYAPYQEYGTRFMQAHPFVRPALASTEPEFERDIKKALEG